MAENKDIEKKSTEEKSASVKSAIALKEEEILKFWQENDTFKKTLDKEAHKGEFVFYDGPPFATGLPHAGSLLASISKDAIPRYKTMQGFYVRRRWGWDTHGLPIESLVEKKLGLKTKKDILNIGIDVFNETARSLVLQYVSDWKWYVERVGRWVDFDNSYKTMDTAYIESVWWALKQIYDKGKLYEGNRVLMYCPHCETPLAKAEIAMDDTYKDVTEEAVTIKFKVIKSKFENDLTQATYLLAWTTTPWTLPGNVALAVHRDTEYVTIEKKDMGTGSLVRFILAEERLKDVFGEDEYKVIEKQKGKDLIGLQYEPLYTISVMGDHKGKKYSVVGADFVTTTEGTGIVHTAVMYGEDDYALGQKEGLPMVQLLDASATFNDKAPEIIRGQYIKKAEKTIKADLETRGLIFRRAMNTHSYPHCYRCGTPLIYNAVPSWFIDIQSVKKRMLKENEKINWIPEHLKDGRFKNIVDNAPDWTISRNRFWASPIPIWKERDGKGLLVIGSIDELKKYSKKSGNRYFFVRHGEAEHNVLDICSSDPESPFHVTEKGKEHVRATVMKLKSERVDMIIRSPFLRAKETADIIAEGLGFDKEKIKEDSRVAEYNFGDFNLKSWDEYSAFRKGHEFDMNFSVPNGESLQQTKNRFGDFLYDLEEKYKDKNIIVVTHGVGFQVVPSILVGMDGEHSAGVIRNTFRNIPDAYMEPFSVTKLSHNSNYELDLHRPYIDKIILEKDGKEYIRTTEVVDCWVESGCMPFAEYHYPFENKKEFEKRFPGDFVSEYIAQTRTWFYYMHSLGNLLFDKLAFKNVLTTGTLLAADGSKISKSKANYTDPLDNIDRFSADAFRFYLLGSVVMKAEDFNFKDEDLRVVQNRVVSLLSNTYTFFLLFKNDYNPLVKAKESTHILDKWIMSRLNQVIERVTYAFDHFDTVSAARQISDFVDDLSTWYVRRSRNRVKGENVLDKQFALSTMHKVFLDFAKVIAPIMPFISEEIFQGVRLPGDSQSVHLEAWPKAGKVDEELLKDMKVVRDLVSVALEKRSTAQIKVRQPLSKLKVKSEVLKSKLELIELVKDEVNIKEVTFGSSISDEMELDTVITPELKEEGDTQDVIRAFQELRKEKGLTPDEKVTGIVSISENFAGVIERNMDRIKKVTNISNIKVVRTSNPNTQTWFEVSLD
jgi:isoleucyl-tRNA synthetase